MTGISNRARCCAAFCLTALFLTGCSAPASGTKSEDSSFSSGNVGSAAQSAAESSWQFVDPERQNVVFIGNSLTYTGGIPERVGRLIDEKEVKIIDLTVSGYTLSQHVSRMADPLYDEVFEYADAVIFQEYGSSGVGTTKSLKQLIGRFSEEAALYYLYTDFDISLKRYERELKGLSRLTYIPTGYVYERLITEGFPRQAMHMSEEDYHPSRLYGYASALTVNGVVFHCKAVDSDVSWLDRKTKNLMEGTPGLTRLQQIVDETVADQAAGRLTYR